MDSRINLNNDMKTRITIAKGDGIGPEIMDATLRILEAAGAQLEYDEIQVGYHHAARWWL